MCKCTKTDVQGSTVLILNKTQLTNIYGGHSYLEYYCKCINKKTEIGRVILLSSLLPSNLQPPLKASVLGLIINDLTICAFVETSEE